MKSKICTKCKEEKPLSEFHKDIQKISELSSSCKECKRLQINRYSKTHQKEKQIYDKKRRDDKKDEIRAKKIIYYNKNKIFIFKKEKNKHKKFPWKRLFSGIKQRCNNKKSSSYKTYGEKGIKCLITEDEIKQLWIRDKAWLLKQPSIDRIDNDGNYEFSNCQFIELIENIKKDKMKPIMQFDLEGNFIREWNSAKEASDFLKCAYNSVYDALNNKGNTCKGFTWKYKEIDTF